MFKVKFDTYSNLNIQNSIVMLTFSVSSENTVFRQIWSKSEVLQKFKVHGFSNPDKKCRVKYCSGMPKSKYIEV